MKKRSIQVSLVVMFICFLFIFSGNTYAFVENNTSSLAGEIDLGENYEGFIKIYVVEPDSRWDDYDDNPYQFGFLGFALEKGLDIPYLDTYEVSEIWDSSWYDFDIYEDNIMVIAVIFNSAAELGYSDPPDNTKPFDAYYVDATAAATPGNIGYNEVTDDFTHTVFIEEGTGTWCQYCPRTRVHLHNIYESGIYPFFYVALVEDKKSVARNRLVDDYNILGYPTAFYDGGYQVVLGGYEEEEPYIEALEVSGARDVHELDLSVSLEWLGGNKIKVDVNITNNEITQNRPPRKPERPNGPGIALVDEEYEFTAVTVDYDMHDIYYMFDWGDNTTSEWIGPLNSGETIADVHTWTEKGSYQVRVIAMDTEQGISDWSEPLGVAVPKFKGVFSQFFFDIFENYPRLNTIIRSLLNY